MKPKTAPAFEPLNQETVVVFRNLATRYNRQWLAALKGPGSRNKGAPLAARDIEDIQGFMQRMSISDSGWKRFDYVPLTNRVPLDAMIKEFMEHPGLSLTHVVRFLLLMGFLVCYPNRSGFIVTLDFQLYILHYRNFHKLDFGLGDIAEALIATGLSGKMVGYSCLLQMGDDIPFMWDADSAHGFFMEHHEILAEIFGRRPHGLPIPPREMDNVRRKAFSIIEGFPHIPGDCLDWLLETALGTNESDRARAQRRLEVVPGILPRILEYLKSNQKDKRKTAASWLAKLNATDALPALHEALKKEKNAAAYGVMLNALLALGGAFEEFLDREKLKKQAAESLFKKKPPHTMDIPKSLSWFPFDLLPVVHWADSGEEVGSDVLAFMVIRGVKLKTHESAAEIRLFQRCMHEAERVQLGDFLLNTCLAQDTTLKEKGMLALLPVCLSTDSVAAVENYLVKWSRKKATECRTLIAMLAWSENSMALQLLLSIPGRFRSKRILEEAEKNIRLLMERKHWSRDDVADRSIPMAGFDAAGRMVLDYGERSIICRPGKNLELLFTDMQDKPLKGLSGKGPADDAGKVKAAKKKISETKKILKTLPAMMLLQFYENMSFQRKWLFADLDRYLFKHPLASNFCSCLVWAQMVEGKPVSTFRPSLDGGLVDAAGKGITMEKTASIRLAHSCYIEAKQVEAWRLHFHDLDAAFFLPQFPTEFFESPAAEEEAVDISDFKGYMLDNVVLKRTVDALGYTVGRRDDPHYFFRYVKPFVSRGIEAVIEFSGAKNSSEQKKVALVGAYFRKIWEKGDPAYVMHRKLLLIQIPAVLVSETWKDIKQVAAVGSGFAEDWQNKI
ncbi:MAG: DUF4132 domain-containing protein [bacterium]|nr:DUF4132 domain-containing protein [bacterium]